MLLSCSLCSKPTSINALQSKIHVMSKMNESFSPSLLAGNKMCIKPFTDEWAIHNKYEGAVALTAAELMHFLTAEISNQLWTSDFAIPTQTSLSQLGYLLQISNNVQQYTACSEYLNLYSSFQSTVGKRNISQKACNVVNITSIISYNFSDYEL